MLVRKEPHSCGRLVKRRSVDYDGPESISQRPSMERMPRKAIFFLNLHSTAPQDAGMLKGLPEKVSVSMPRRLSD
jgi:hypothetical protein